MKYAGTLIAVTDINRSKQFYHDLLGLDIIGDFDVNVQLEGGIFLQTVDTWKEIIQADDVILGNHAMELYFEVDNMDVFLGELDNMDIKFVHQPLEHNWGQRVVRFYDPDQHIIEVGENINMVVKRFFNSGMTVAEVAVRMDVPIEYVENCLSKQ
jgi:catechol 2,3-dioxygenase-like lactoylglutathione lyase family enzyme